MAPVPPGTSAVEHEVRISAPPKTVFSYLTDPVKLARWMGEATMDPRPGGVFRAETIDGSLLLGRFVAVEPYTRVVFTWGFETRVFGMPPQSTEVEVTLTPEDDGTTLRLVHRDLPEEAVEFHRVGWGHYLERLIVAGAGGDPGPDPWRAASESGPADDAPS